MNPLNRAWNNRKTRRDSLNDEGTAYHGTNASSSPQDTRWWRSVPRDVGIQVPDQFAFMARIREIVTTYPQAFDDATGTFLFHWLDTVQETWITEINRAFNDAIFQEKGLYIEDARRARESTQDEQRLHAAVTLHDKQYRAALDHLLGKSGATAAWDEKTPATGSAISMTVPVPASLNTASPTPGTTRQETQDADGRSGSAFPQPAPLDVPDSSPSHRGFERAAGEEDTGDSDLGRKSA